MEERDDWSSDTRISIDKGAIKIGKVKEDLNILDGRRDEPFYDGNDMIGFYWDSIRGDDEAEERDRGNMKATFLEFTVQSKIAKPWQNFLYKDDILLKSIGINEDIVEIYKVKNIQKLTEAIIHICLKGYEGISKVEAHDYNRSERRFSIHRQE